MGIKFKKLDINAKIIKPRQGDIGYDVYAIKNQLILENDIACIPLGLALEFDEKYYCKVEDKSGIFKNKGLTVGGTVIDSSYRGEINCQLFNITNKVQHIKAEEKICQLVFIKADTPDLEEFKELSNTDRGIGRFGSTGK
ncbi:MAG: hypothetical protein KAX49_13140 [Halanaerobiales bacterium]|nr:hypothetical protein [Halanaerobiales bacterium]